MPKFWYAVTATLPSAVVADEYVRWLEDGHLEQVLAGGAHSAMIVRLERAPGDGLAEGARQVLTQYIFATKPLFDRYAEHSAPSLRADGLARFGPDRGVRFERRLGEVV